MKDYTISINHLAEFRNSTTNARKRIVAQQLKPDKFRVPWYQLTKSKLKKCLELKGDLQPVLDGIAELTTRKTETARQLTDKKVSIEALNRFIQMKLPTVFKDFDYLVIIPKQKSIIINGVKIIISPDLVIKGKVKGKVFYGAIKIHISKSKPFDFQQSKIVSRLVYEYLNNEIIEDDSMVLPEMCLCFDIFGERIVSADLSDSDCFDEILDMCSEVKSIWNAA